MTEHVIRTLAEQSFTALELAPFGEGFVWRSSRVEGPSSIHDADIPGGLHIGCGVADMETALPGRGGFSARTGAFILMRVPEEGATCRTTTRSGPLHSAGIHLPSAGLDGLGEPLDKLLAALDEYDLLSVTGRAAFEALRLSQPLSPHHGEDVRELLLAARGLELVALALSLFAPSAKRRAAVVRVRSTQRHRRIAAEVRELLEDDLAAPRLLQELASSVATSPRVMTQAFRECFGESIGEYLTRRRLEEALRLLQAGAGVAEAAWRVGYHPNSFSTAFKRFYGQPPSALVR